YASGRVAACANKINDYQRSFQFYEDNKKRTLLATLDEHAVGSVGRPGGKKMILTKECGIILDGQDVIRKKAGSPPSEPVVINLNDNLVFTYRDRSSISIKFAPCPGILVDFACGESLRRTDSYFDHAHRATEGPHRGRLLIDQDTPTLQQRQKRYEIGQVPTLFGSVVQANDASDSLKRLKNEFNGKWLGSVEIHISGSQLDLFLRDKCENDELVVVACLRADDRQSRTAESMLEQVQLILSERKKNPTNPATEFYDSQLVHVSSLGGVALRVAPTTKNAHLSGQMDHLPRVLLVEKVAKQQLAVESFLRREGFQWDLASSGEQAVTNFTRQPSSGATSSSGPASGYELVMLSDSLTDSEVRAIDRFAGPKERLKRKTGRRVLTMCQACRRAQGRRVRQELAASAEGRTLLAEMAQAVVYKHVKAATLHRLAEITSARRGPRHFGESHMGLTPFSFFAEVDKQVAAAKRGAFLPAHRVPEMALSAKDTVLSQHPGTNGRQAVDGLSVLQMDQLRSASA
uniref:Uncharacterized protein n=1 Tax=Phytophthora ramorum TaxID=164328 RepID=H3HD20_PHYRM